MITGSILGLPAVGMILMSMPCINLGNEPQGSKNKRTILGGVLILIVGKKLYFTLFTQCNYELVDKDKMYSKSKHVKLFCAQMHTPRSLPTFLTVTSCNPTSNAYKPLRGKDVEYDCLPPRGAHICTHTHTLYVPVPLNPSPQIPSHSSPPPTLIHTLPLS